MLHRKAIDDHCISTFFDWTCHSRGATAKHIVLRKRVSLANIEWALLLIFDEQKPQQLSFNENYNDALRQFTDDLTTRFGFSELEIPERFVNRKHYIPTGSLRGDPHDEDTRILTAKMLNELASLNA